MKQDICAGGTSELAGFCANLRPGAIPDTVFDRITELFVDWLGSALSGRNHRAIKILEDFSTAMGPSAGHSEVLISGKRTSPFFAALVNAASSHISEQDDVHNGSVFHPATIVFPATLALAQEIKVSGEAFLTACVAGYETGIRIGEYLGRSHYKVFHTTGTAGTFAAATAAGHILGLDEDQMIDAFGSAGTQSAGLWEFLRDAADSKQLHTAKSSCEGLMSAWIASKGFTGAKQILEGQKGLAAGTSTDADITRLTDQLGQRWCVLETSFKYHASCRHTHPSADALLKVILENDLKPADISSITCHVHQAAIDVLGAVVNPQSVHQAKFSMGATLGLISCHRKAGLEEFSQFLSDEDALMFLNRVEMQLDEEVNSIYPEKWIGKVTVETTDGKVLKARVDDPKGDPGNMLTREEIDDKARYLIRTSGLSDTTEIKKLVPAAWNIRNFKAVPYFTAKEN